MGTFLGTRKQKIKKGKKKSTHVPIFGLCWGGGPWMIIWVLFGWWCVVGLVLGMRDPGGIFFSGESLCLELVVF